MGSGVLRSARSLARSTAVLRRLPRSSRRARFVWPLLAALLAAGTGGVGATTFGAAADFTGLAQAQVEARLDHLREAGVRALRTGLSWPEVEPSRGKFTWTRYDALVDAATARGMTVIFTLGPTPQWASRGGADVEPAGRARMLPAKLEDWSRYVGAAVTHFRGRVRFWQVWERSDFRRLRAPPSGLLKLLDGAHRSLRQADPQARLICPEPGGLDIGFLAKLSRREAWQQFDIIGLFPTLHEPEDLLLPVSVLQREALGDPAVAKPVWILGMDWPSGADVPASYPARTAVLAAGLGVETVFWDETVPGAPGSLLDKAEALTPRGQAWQRTAGWLEGQTPAGYVLADGLVGWLFRPNSGSSPANDASPATAILWRTGAAAPLTVGVSSAAPQAPDALVVSDGAALSIASADGGACALDLASGQADLPVGEWPVRLGPVATDAGGLCWQPPAPDRAALLAGRPFLGAKAVGIDFGADSPESGLHLLTDRPGGAVENCIVDGRKAVRSPLSARNENDNPFIYFGVDDAFLYFDRGQTEVTVTVRCLRTDAPQKTGFDLLYDAVDGQRFSEWAWVEPGTGWQDISIVLHDVNFADRGGYDFLINSKGSRANLTVGAVSVAKTLPKPPAEAAPGTAAPSPPAETPKADSTAGG
jgi:hypothetical protein